MDIVQNLLDGGVGVLATDTLYGLVALANNQQAVERIYEIKHRAPTKPFIILISDIKQLDEFGIVIKETTRAICEKYWPGPVSIILPTARKDLAYLHRGTGSLAFRLPNKQELTEIIAKTGPLVAPSANPEGLPPVSTVDEARYYFGEAIDFYIDSGEISGAASKIIAITNRGEEVIRP